MRGLLIYISPSSVLKLQNKPNTFFKYVKKRKPPCLYPLHLLFFRCPICNPTRMKTELWWSLLKVDRSKYHGIFSINILARMWYICPLRQVLFSFFFPKYPEHQQLFPFSRNYNVNSGPLKNLFQSLFPS